MDYTKWTPVKFWSVLFICFFVGFVIRQPEKVTVTKEVPKEVVKEVVKESCPQLSLWKDLKDTDDLIMRESGDGFHTASNMIDATAKGDVQAMELYTDEIVKIGKRIDSMANVRNAILQKLGY